MSISDRFEIFPVDEMYDLLGVYPSTEPLPDTLLNTYKEDDGTWKEYSNHINKWKPEYRENLKLYDHPDLLVPKAEQYPILVYWNWLDDYDRHGKIRERCFMWWSMDELNNVRSLKNTRQSWDLKYAKDVEESLKAYEKWNKEYKAKL